MNRFSRCWALRFSFDASKILLSTNFLQIERMLANVDVDHDHRYLMYVHFWFVKALGDGDLYLLKMSQPVSPLRLEIHEKNVG